MAIHKHQIESIISDIDGEGRVVGFVQLLDRDSADLLAAISAASRRELREGTIKVVVVGTFSSGKSTLINRLVGDEVLPSGRGVVTARPVEIGKGRERAAGWRRGEQVSSQPLPAPTSISAWVLSGQTHGSADTHLQVTLPTWPFDPGVTIVDTPGFNSEESHHRTLAEAALGEAGVAILVVEARGMTEDVRAFVADGVLSKVPLLAVVINQLDMVDEEDVDELLQRARSQLRELGRASAPVIACSARGHADPRGRFVGWDGVRAWISELAGHRIQAVVAVKVARALELAMEATAAGAERERGRIEEALATTARELDDNDPAGLQQMIAHRRDQVLGLLDRRSDSAKASVHAAGSHFAQEVSRWLDKDSSDVTDSDKVERKIRKCLNEYGGKVGAILSELDREGSTGAQQLHADLRGEVSRRWQVLREQCGTSVEFLGDANAGTAAASTAGGLDVDVGDLPSDFGGVAGGALAGAAIGSFVPFVGTIVGGLIGVFVGWFSGSARRKAVDQINEAAEGLRARAVAQALGEVTSRQNNWKKYDRKLAKRQLDAFTKVLSALQKSLVVDRAALQEREKRASAVTRQAQELLARVRTLTAVAGG